MTVMLSCSRVALGGNVRGATRKIYGTSLLPPRSAIGLNITLDISDACFILGNFPSVRMMATIIV
jgi:hypothetical protein